MLPSAVLGLEGVVQGKLLRFRDPVTGLLIPTAEEAEQARRELKAQFAELRAKPGQ